MTNNCHIMSQGEIALYYYSSTNAYLYKIELSENLTATNAYLYKIELSENLTDGYAMNIKKLLFTYLFYV